METTKPFLYVDLEKSITRAQAKAVHKDLPEGGVWRTVRGHHIYIVGKKVVAGAIPNVRGNGAKKATKEHLADHQKFINAEAKAKRAKSAATGQKTKATNKANAIGKTGKAKVLEDPTSKAKVPKMKTAKATQKARTDAMSKKARAEKKAIRESKKERDLNAPVLKRNTRHDMVDEQEVKQAIPQNTAPSRKKTQKADNQAVQDAKNVESLPSEEKETIDSMWNSPQVQKLLAKPAGKRSLKEIKKVAGEITQSNDKLARYVVQKLASARGIHLAHNIIGNKATPSARVIRQETGMHADMLQSARATMFETLHNVLAGSQNPGEGTSIGKHVLSRMKHKLHRDMYDLMNDIPAPHEIRNAIGEMRKHENTLSQKLGRTPTHDELAQHLEGASEAFKKAPIVPAPYWDEKKNDWVASNKRIQDPAERLRMLKNYAGQQKAVSADKNVGSEGEKEVGLSDSIEDRNARPDEILERRERQKELKGAIPKALNDMGFNDKEMKTFMYTYGQASEKQNKPFSTAAEVAERINSEGGHGELKNVSPSWVAKHLQAGMAKLGEARKSNHPALDQLKLLKSLFLNMVLKTMYEMDLVKSLNAWGVDHTILEQQYVRTATAANMTELRKSLEPSEYIGSYVTTEYGEISARVVEFTLPENNELYKSFNMFMSDIKKSMFPHKAGSNHAANKKASDYIKSNAGKYKGVSETQHARAKAKGGGHTWSEQLLLKNPGSAWITWGGKKILVNAGTGEIIYDSKNDMHREEHNQGAQEDKIDFHHEKDALDEHEENREKGTRDAWKKHLASKEGKGKAFDYGKERESFAKKNRGVSFDGDGNMQFKRDEELNDDNAHIFDHGVQAFRDQMEDMKHAWSHKKDDGSVGGLKGDMLNTHAHKALDMYGSHSEEDRAKMDAMSPEERTKHIGDHFLATEGTKEALQKYHDAIKSGENSSEAEKEVLEHLKGIGSVAGRNARMMERFLKTVQKHNPSSEGNMDALSEAFGGYEMQRAREEANKNLIPEGKYMIGNPITGKTMVVHIGGGFEGGRGGKGNKYAPKVMEAFDPEGGNHEEINSWGQLGKALGYQGADASKLKEILTQTANTDSDKPFMKQIEDSEFNAHRANTKAGLQDSMTHKNFKLVAQNRDKAGNMQSQTFAQDMEDGTQNVVSVDNKGYIQDPVMARLINQKKAIQNANDLHEVLKQAVGNRAWVTAHFGSDVHIGDALGHHIQLEYDGKGAPKVVGGKYDGYRYMDTKDVPKGATDPATGEPIKALFKNGKLVDRKFTTKNEVPMKQGNPVMYQDENGKYKKGRIHSVQGDSYKITDGKGHVIGMHKKDTLKPVMQEGRTLSDSGQAVVRVAETGAHRMNTSETFKNPHEGKEKLTRDEKKTVTQSAKARKLFEAALKKAKVNSAFDSEGKLNDNLDLSDAARKRLEKVLGRSKAGRDMLQNFKTTSTKELEVHVPDSMREQMEAEGVKVKADGTARISASKFEHLREALGGMSIDNDAREFLTDHFKRKDRVPKTKEELEQNYQPFKVPNNAFGKAYKSLFKPTYVSQESYTDAQGNKRPGGLYSTQLEGLGHLVERGRGIAGHGMGTGKTILGVMAHAHYKATKLANGEKPKKTLIVSPAGIQSDWGKEIGSHTNMKALYVGSTSKLRKQDADGNWMKSEGGRNMFGQDGSEQEAVGSKDFLKNMDKHASEDHDFHIMSYDQFMKMRDELSNSGMYDNIVIDEVHAFKNQKGQRGKSLAETTDKYHNVWGLSGTPMENDAREIHSLIDTITGGRHELGTQKEFQEKYMIKDRNGKITGVKPTMAPKLGDILANVVQFRGGEDVQYNDGSKIHFPNLVGDTSKDPNPQTDFIGNMVDKNRDHATTDYYGTKHSTTDFEQGTKTVTNKKNGESYEVPTFTPKNLTPDMKQMYDRYGALQAKYLPESKLNELASAASTGYDTGQKGKSNYLTAMQKLQKFLNAPLADKMYVPGGNSAIESDMTDAQGATLPKADKQEPIPYETDSDGNKRYYEADGKGGHLTNADGSPKLLPPLHHNNPKAQYLKQRVGQYLDSLQQENANRRKAGKPELMPKVVVKSAYTTFGTDIVDGVLRDLQKEHPELMRWNDKLGGKMTAGRFTGDADDREETKMGFRGNKNDYEKNQGNLWATTVSPAGKEGVDFGNAHAMFHFDQDWNPQKMAQFTARVRRSDSVKTHQQMGRANAVRVESLHMPGTIEDFMFNAQDSKMRDIKQVVDNTREAEKAPKLGDTEGGLGFGSSGFTRGKRNRKGATPKNTEKTSTPLVVKTGAGQPTPKQAVAAAEKAFKLVILL